MFPACEISSSTIRDLPIPGSPTSSTTRPRRRVADSSASDSARISWSRPIRGGASRCPSRRRSGAPSIEGPHRFGLPLHGERGELLGLEPRPRPSERGLGREDLSLGRLPHDAGGEVHRITPDRVRASVRRSEHGGEDPAGVHPDPQG